MTTLISLQNVSVKKGTHCILKQLTWELQAGEKWVVIGKNGSGKSTFFDLLLGRIYPVGGKRVVAPHTKISLAERDYSFDRLVKQSYLYYQQRYHSFDTSGTPTLWEVLQNQTKPLGTVHNQSVELPPLAFEEQELQKWAETFRISHLLERKIISLSNGEVRRSLLVRSILQNPTILLLDNPFSGLDIENRQILRTILGQLAETNTTIVLTCSHQDIPSGFTKGLELEEGKITKQFDWPNPHFTFEEEKHSFDFSPIKTLQPPIPLDSATIFDLRNIRVNYPPHQILDGISWKVQAGEAWALLGANGSGKSTLLSILTADHPQAYLNDFSLFGKKRGTGESIWEIKRRIGFVSPEIHLFVDKSIPAWKVIGSGFFDATGLYKKLDKTQEAILESYITLLHLEPLRDRTLRELSMGEQRRVLLARALVKNPPVLILDEPCQGLDTNQMIYFRDLVHEITVQLGKTLIYVTHYEEEIPACVTKKLVLYAGKILPS